MNYVLLDNLQRVIGHEVEIRIKDGLVTNEELVGLLSAAKYNDLLGITEHCILKWNKENTKPQRKTMSNRLRFLVFERDSFRCSYCGNTAQDSKLEVDHVIPVSKGGDDQITNLTTACYECNRGKFNHGITD